MLRYEDNGDAVTNFLVITRDTDKKSISDYGSEEDFLKTTISPLLGQQVFTGRTPVALALYRSDIGVLHRGDNV